MRWVQSRGGALAGCPALAGLLASPFAHPSPLQLDAKLHEAQAASSRVALATARLEQEKEIMEKSNKWLSEELERKVGRWENGHAL